MTNKTTSSQLKGIFPHQHVPNRVLVSGSPASLAKFEDVLKDDPKFQALIKPVEKGEAMVAPRINPVQYFDGTSWKKAKLTLPKTTKAKSLQSHYLNHQNRRDISTRRYSIAAKQSVYEVAATLRALLNNSHDTDLQHLSVFTENIAHYSSANPGSGGSPSPDLREFARAATQATAKQYQEQDCFKRIGAEDLSNLTNKGQDVTVVILDTAPKLKYVDSKLVDFFIDMAGPDNEFSPLQRVQLEPPNNCPDIIQTVAPHPVPVGDYNLQDVKLEQYHGLMAASIIKRLAPEAKVVLVKVLNNRGEVAVSTLTGALEYVGYLHHHQVLANDVPLMQQKLVINLSLGFPRTLSEEVEACYLLETCENLCKAGIVMACAAGNDSYQGRPKNPEEPAAYGYFTDTVNTNNQVIAVAATTEIPHAYAFFSNRGNLAARGWEIMLDTGENSEHRDTTRYIYWSGTSFTTPQISAACALLLGKGILPAQVKKKLWDTATMPDIWNGVAEINLAKALS